VGQSCLFFPPLGSRISARRSTNSFNSRNGCSSGRGRLRPGSRSAARATASASIGSELWDREIAKECGVGGMKKVGQNADRYLRFMAIVQEQCKQLPSERSLGRNRLRALDEYNICKVRGLL
jgi:hypothetical protein